MGNDQRVVTERNGQVDLRRVRLVSEAV